MVVSRDWQEVSVLECILGGLHMDVSVENEPQRALARLNKSKIDALIVDCDLNGSSQFLRELQSAESPRTVPLVIMGGPQLHSESGGQRRAVCLRETDFGGTGRAHTIRCAQHDSRRTPPLSPRRPRSAGRR